MGSKSQEIFYEKKKKEIKSMLFLIPGCFTLKNYKLVELKEMASIKATPNKTRSSY